MIFTDSHPHPFRPRVSLPLKAEGRGIFLKGDSVNTPTRRQLLHLSVKDAFSRAQSLYCGLQRRLIPDIFDRARDCLVLWSRSSLEKLCCRRLWLTTDVQLMCSLLDQLTGRARWHYSIVGTGENECYREIISCADNRRHAGTTLQKDLGSRRCAKGFYLWIVFTTVSWTGIKTDLERREWVE